MKPSLQIWGSKLLWQTKGQNAILLVKENPDLPDVDKRHSLLLLENLEVWNQT